MAPLSAKAPEHGDWPAGPEAKRSLATCSEDVRGQSARLGAYSSVRTATSLEYLRPRADLMIPGAITFRRTNRGIKTRTAPTGVERVKRRLHQAIEAQSRAEQHLIDAEVTLTMQDPEYRRLAKGLAKPS